MKKIVATLTLPLLITACQSTGEANAMAKVVKAQDLQHHNWVLTAIDGVAVTPAKNQQAPNLEIGEKLTANGNAGCNNYFGQAELDGNKFRIDQMGMTMKMCINDAMKTERAMQKNLTEWSEITLTKETMTLTNGLHTLTFKLSDWK